MAGLALKADASSINGIHQMHLHYRAGSVDSTSASLGVLSDIVLGEGWPNNRHQSRLKHDISILETDNEVDENNHFSGRP